MTIQPQDLISALSFRYATKQFDPTRKIDPASWDALLQSLVLAPSSFGLQPWRFLVINNPEIRASLREVSWNQPQITEADRLVVITTRTDMTPGDIDAWMHCLAETQGKSPEALAAYRVMIDGFVGSLDTEARKNWNTRQCYIALGQLMTSAAMIGVDTCPLEGIDTAAYDQILDLENSGYATAVACAIGYRSPGDAYATTPKARFHANAVIRQID